MSKRIFTPLVAAILLFAVSCSAPKEDPKTEISVIGKHELKLESELMTPEVLWSFGRVGGAEVSPDKSKIVYGVSYYSIPEDKGNRDLFVMDIDGNNKKQLTKTTFGEYEAQWKPGSETIGFMSAESGSMQIWEINSDGNNKTQISFVDGGINGFKYSPDGKQILYAAEVAIENSMKDLYKGLDKATGRIMNDLMYRHWDTWVDSYSHIFIADFDGNNFSKGTDIMKGEPYESPMKPFGGMEQINWSFDGAKVFYTCRKKVGKEYAISTNSDIYCYDLGSKKTKNLTKGMMGYDVAPVPSPDGKYLAWESMERDGYEADKNRIFVMNIENGEKRDYSENFDQSSHGFSWSDDSKGFYFLSNRNSTGNIYHLDITTGKIKTIAEEICNYQSVIPLENSLIAQRVSMSHPADIYSVDIKSGKAANLSKENDEILNQLTFGKVTKRMIKTTDGKDMLTWVILPPNFDENKEYPAILYCKGGPQGAMGQSWSYRWNFQIMAANGYVIVAPARRGVDGHGQEWQEQISGDYGGQNMKDYLSAIDEMKQEPWIDEDRLGSVGASYGGFSVYWLAGKHENRFKAFIAHDGMFNLEAQYLETEEMWFVNFDLGGPYWDKENKIAQKSYANSPHKFVKDWNTPILIIHSEKDYRIVASQGMSAFNAAVLNDVPAEYLYFPNENHWVLHPQNGILWQRTFFNWLDKYLK